MVSGLRVLGLPGGIRHCPTKEVCGGDEKGFQAGIKGELLQWIEGFPSRREQRTRVGGAFSNWVGVTRLQMILIYSR